MGSDYEKNPWKTLSSKVMYQNPWIRVREDQVIRPDGKPGIYGVVETRIATGVIALSDAGEIYLVGQYRYPLNCYSWEIIEGGSESNEGALATAQRELIEEAGLKARDWQQLGAVVHLSNCFTSEEGYVFLARGLEEVAARPDETEVLQLRKMPFEEAVALVDSGAITDALSIIGIQRAQQFLRRGA